MIFLFSFTILKKTTLTSELTAHNFIYKDTIIINFRNGGSIFLNKDGKILKNNLNWTIVYKDALYEFQGGANEDCISIAKLSYDYKKIGFIVGCEREGYEVKLNDNKISLGGDIVDFGIVKDKAYIFVNGTVFVYNLNNNKEEKRIRDISELGMAKFLCNNSYCVFSDLSNKVIIFDANGNEIKRIYNKNWEYISLLAIDNRYLLFAHYNFKEGGYVNLLDLNNFEIVFKKGMSYMEGDNTACLLKDYIILLDGENLVKIDYKGITLGKLKLNTQWLLCTNSYIVSGGLDKDKNVYIIKP